MVLGECPYEDCDEPMMLGVPDSNDVVLPAMLPHDCEGCERTIWTKVTRLDPWSMTDDEFREEYDVDDEAQTVKGL